VLMFKTVFLSDSFLSIFYFIRNEDDEVHLVLDQHAELDF
jgi:hypothetical protein